MALDERTIMTKPLYWTAAIYHVTPGRGYQFQGWMPTVRASMPAMLDRLMYLERSSSPGKRVSTIAYYWDGKAWVPESKKPGSVAGSASVGALERKNPLPPGRYWQNFIGRTQIEAWNAWALKNQSSLRVINSEDQLPGVDRPEHIFWVLFQTSAPLEWPGVTMGFPTIATADIATASDTASVPPTPTSAEILADAFEKIGSKVVTPALTVLGVYLGIKLVLALRK
jgi:hypothetical protein